MARHVGSAAGASSRRGAGSWRIAGGAGLTGSGSGAGSRTLSASWIADSAASVGSFIFFGVFAMSVVASHYAGPGPRPASSGPRHERASLEVPSGFPLGQPAVTRRADIPLPFDHPTGLANRRKRLVKVSLIIVNARAGAHGCSPSQWPAPVAISPITICPVTLRPACGRATLAGNILRADCRKGPASPPEDGTRGAAGPAERPGRLTLTTNAASCPRSRSRIADGVYRILGACPASSTAIGSKNPLGGQHDRR